jgi:hypothetical protein
MSALASRRNLNVSGIPEHGTAPDVLMVIYDLHGLLVGISAQSWKNEGAKMLVENV